MKQTDPQLKLRLPPALKELIDAAAQTSRQTMSGEIIERLEWTFANNQMFAEYQARSEVTSKLAAQRILAWGTPQADLQGQVDELRMRVELLEAKSATHDRASK